MKTVGNESRTVAFKYDPFGRRIGKSLTTTIDGTPATTKTSTWTYVYDDDNVAVEIYTDPTGTTEKTFYTHGAGVDEHLALERGGQFYYYHADGLGSIVAITDSSKAVVQTYEYDSFGMVKPSMGFRNSYAYTGREWDKEAGLYYYRARYYDPMEGRFISKDPIGFKGGINLYSYVHNNPLNRVDPRGLSGCGPGDGWGDWLVPDYPNGHNFKSCCDTHDDCYGCEGKKAGKSKQDCDRQFCKCLIKKCMSRLWLPTYCPSMEYCLAVSIGGEKAFDNARKCCN